MCFSGDLLGNLVAIAGQHHDALDAAGMQFFHNRGGLFAQLVGNRQHAQPFTVIADE